MTDCKDEECPNSFVGAVYLPPYLCPESIKTWFSCLFYGERFFNIPLSPVFERFIDFLVADLLLVELTKFFSFNFEELNNENLSYEFSFLSE